MSTLRLVHDIALFDDTEYSNAPDMGRLGYKLDQQETLTADFRLDQVLPAATVTAISQLPAGTYKWLYILANQPIAVRLSGHSGDQYAVSPSTNGTMDGIFVKRGDFTSLSINVAGATAARVIILAGA